MFKVSFTAALLALSLAEQAHACYPASRYTVQSGGAEVLDTRTGLIWQRCSLGQSWSGAICAGSAQKYTWQSALEAARDLGNGWRVPNFKELQSLVEEVCYSPAIHDAMFPATETAQLSYYWSSSTYVINGYHAWIVSFAFGLANHDFKGNKNNYVRVVRSGQ